MRGRRGIPNPRDSRWNHYRSVRRAGTVPLVLGLLAVLSLLAGWGEALAQSRAGKSWEIAPIAATVTVSAPSRDLPAGLAEEEIAVNELTPLELRELVGRIADLAGVEALVQERPGRVLNGDVEMNDPVPFGLSMTGTVPDVLDEVARLSGYDWGWEDGRLLFYRYADVEQRAPERMPGGVPVGVLAAVAEEEIEVFADLRGEPADRDAAAPEAVGEERGASPETREGVDAEGRSEAGRVAPAVSGELEPGGRPVDPDAAEAVEGQGQAAPEGTVPAEPAGWKVIPGTHATVEDVLRFWAERAGWQLAWKSERRFEVGAEAEFPAGENEEAGFLAAADALLAIGPMRRVLSATAYPNKWLVIQDIGSAVQ